MFLFFKSLNEIHLLATLVPGIFTAFGRGLILKIIDSMRTNGVEKVTRTPDPGIPLFCRAYPA